MPRVPTVEGPSLQTNAAPNAYQTAPTALGEAGMAQARQLGQLAELAKQQQNRDDIDTVFRAETALKDDYLKFERDELGKSGADAKGTNERAAAWWGEAQAKYADGLTGRQRFAFDRSATQLRQASQSTLARHEQHQVNESLKESAQARVGTAVETAIADPTSERLALSRKEIAEAVGMAGKAAGYTPEITQAKVTEALSLMHKGVVMRLVDNDPDAAKAYYYGNRKEIGGGTQITLEKALQHGGMLQKAQEAADKITVEHPDLADAMAYVEKNFQGEEEKAVKLEVQSRYATIKGAKNEISTQAYGSALLAVQQGQRVPADVWSKMDDSHRAAVLQHQEARAKALAAEAAGEKIKTNFAAWDQLNRLVGSDPTAFANEDLGKWQASISKQDLMEFAGLQRKIRSGAEGAHGVATLAQQVDVVTEQLRLEGQSNAEKRGQLKRSIYDALNSEQRQRGRELTYDERQKVIDQQIMQVSVPGFIWGTSEKPAYQLTPEERGKIVVPDADRKLITDALRAKGRPVNDQAVLDLYRRQKGLQ